MPTSGKGSQFTQKFVNRFAKLTGEMVDGANEWGTDCDVGSGEGSGELESDAVFA